MANSVLINPKKEETTMTTTVKVEAHCGDDTEVQITHSSGGLSKVETIQDGESFETVVYDNATCFVTEVKKSK